MLFRSWQRATQKEGNATQKEDIIGNKTGNENGENATQEEENDSGKKWPLPGRNFYIRVL